ncbi:dihydropteroate synthase, partial [Geodermatophilus obscurus]
LVVDPGFGFGKTPAHNVALLASLDGLHSLGVPVMVGLSRKSVLGQLTGRTAQAPGGTGRRPHRPVFVSSAPASIATLKDPS